MVVIVPPAVKAPLPDAQATRAHEVAPSEGTTPLLGYQPVTQRGEFLPVHHTLPRPVNLVDGAEKATSLFSGAGPSVMGTAVTVTARPQDDDRESVVRTSTSISSPVGQW